MNSDDTISRYERQQILAEIAEQGQERLCSAKLVLIGAGGLGCPALQYLVAAGLGANTSVSSAQATEHRGLIRIVDADRVSLSNLHRQILYTESDIGRPKVEAAKARLLSLNSQANIEAQALMLDPDNVDTLCRDADIVLDCADSFAVSYILSDYCFAQEIPYISASAIGFQGYAAGYCAGKPSMRALFPELPAQTASCASAGVCGPVVGVMGSLQAQFAINVLLGLDESPLGRMMTLDLRSLKQSWFRFDNAPEPSRDLSLPFIGINDLLNTDYLVDLRESHTQPTHSQRKAKHLGIDDFLATRPSPEKGQRAVLACRSGVRAWRAAKHLSSYWEGEIALMALGDRSL